MDMDTEAGRAEVAAFMTRLYQQKLTTTSGGNISLRLVDGTVVITAAATDKGRMTAADVAVMGPGGENRTPALKPSSETAMHLEILRRHPRVQAIVHAHPPAASAFCVADRRLNSHLIAEAYALVGEPVFAPYALTGTAGLADSVAGSIGPQTACVLMENHGVLAVGRSLLEAFDRLEVLDNLARIQIYASVLGDARELSQERLRELDDLMGR
ncbi:MAG: class II aldolase/adducin family protein [Lentisphaerae bacterium]|nr:class II aldolase/adducin family protein [Lentisphaerota bacterium]